MCGVSVMEQLVKLSKNSTYGAFGKDNHVSGCTALPDTDPEAWTYGAEFIREGRIWRVSVICNTFIIGTAIDAQRDSSNEVVRHSDLIMVKL